MGRFKINAKVIGILLVIVIIMGGVTWHQVTFGVKSIGQLYKEKPGEISFITLMATLTSGLVGWLVVTFQSTLKSCIDSSNNKSDIIKAQSDQIIATLERNAVVYGELMKGLNENTSNDIKNEKRITQNEMGIEELKKRVSVVEGKLKRIK